MITLIACIIFTGLAFSLTSSKYTSKLEMMLYSKKPINHIKYEEYLTKAKFYHILGIIFSCVGISIGMYLMLKHI